MSLRSDILGWVIRELNGVDAADPGARSGLYAALRQQVASTGAFGALPAMALPHLESAIALQEMQWLRETGHSLEFPPAEPAAQPDQRPSSVSREKPWRWPDGISVPPLPAREAPVEAAGPFSDHLYEDVLLDTPDGKTRLTISWAFDPACTLTASAEAIAFHFHSRAATLSGALDQLEAYLRRGGLSLPAEARTRIC